MSTLVHAEFINLAKKNSRLFGVTLFFLLQFLCIIQSQGHASEAQKVPENQDAAVLTLAQVIDLALGANRSLINSDYGLESRRWSVEAARSKFETKFFPQANVSATNNDRRIGSGLAIEKKFGIGPTARISPEVFRSYDDNTYGSEVGISLTIPLLSGLGLDVNMDGVRTAEHSLRSTIRSHHLVKINTVLEAVSATYNLVQQRELVSLYESQVTRFQGHTIIAEAREKIGLATPIDVYRAQIRLKDAQNSLNRAQEALRNAGDRLKIVLAAPLEQKLNVSAPLFCPPLDINIAKAVETAMQHRVELKQAEDDIQDAKRKSKVSKNRLFPQLNLVTNYSHLENRNTRNDTTETNEDTWSIMLKNKTDLARKSEKADYQTSLLSVKRFRLNRLTRIDSIKREVRQFYVALEKNQERMQIRNDQINQARGKLALANIKFGHGMADNFDLIEAETELQEARTNLLAAKIEYIVGTYRLRAAIGTLIE